MQIVINLSDETYKDIKEENSIYGINNGLSARITGKVVGAIQSGTPLPEGHGDIVGMKTLVDMFWDGNYMEIHRDDLSAIKPLIEADKTENEVRENLAELREVPDIDTISAKSVVDTLKAIEYGYSGYSIKDDRLEGAYMLASELTGLSIDTLSSYVNSGATKEHIEEKDDKGLEEPEEDVER